jgi:cell division protein FtsB
MNNTAKKLIMLQKKLTDKEFYDVRFLALFGVGVISLSVFWNGAKIVQQNFDLSQRVAAIAQENQILALENQNKELRNQYLATDEFAELTARRVFGKAAPGERVYIIPKEFALSGLTAPDVVEEEPLEIKKPQYQENLEKWLNIYFGD